MRRFFSLRGFALIELMVVVAALSLAAAFFVPRFLKNQIRQRQDVCRRNLLSFYEAQKVYHETKGVFASDVGMLAWTPQGDSRYEYHMIRTGEDGFLFECLGNIDKDPTLDRAHIDETGQWEIIQDDVSR